MAWGDISQEGCHNSIQHTIAIIAHDGETWLEQSGGERMGELQLILLLKVNEEGPSVRRWMERGLALGESVGRGGTSMMITLKMG